MCCERYMIIFTTSTQNKNYNLKKVINRVEGDLGNTRTRAGDW